MALQPAYLVVTSGRFAVQIGLQIPIKTNCYAVDMMQGNPLFQRSCPIILLDPGVCPSNHGRQP